MRRIKIVLIFITLLVGYLSFQTYKLIQLPQLPKLDANKYWGKGIPSTKEDTAIRSFKINISDEVLQDLKYRLENARPFTAPLEGIQHQYGFNTNTLKQIVNFWKNDYKWRDREIYINKFTHFKTTIQGLDIHFIHLKPSLPSNKRLIPILLIHGWPDTFLEFYKVSPLLTQSRKDGNFSFELIIPSLPGYGFSQPASKPGFGATEMALLLKILMKRIGHSQFYVHGGDWGGMIATIMATLFPKNILGLHCTLCMPGDISAFLKLMLEDTYPSLFSNEQIKRNMFPLSKKLSSLMEEAGYFYIQATKPDTIGIALNQSPAGLAAYILEKVSVGTNWTYKSRDDAGLPLKFTFTELIDNLMIYWVTNSMTTAARIYAEMINLSFLTVFRTPISPEVPCACARFPNEIAIFSDWILRGKFQNLIETSKFPKGGHFSPIEEPELLATDIFKSITKMEKLRNQNHRLPLLH